MRVRICPICDQPMKKAHRCDSCHSFVWKPEYMDIHYNTDVTGGEDCSYDQQPHYNDYHDDGSVKTMPSRKRREEAVPPEKRNIDTTGQSSGRPGLKLLIIVISLIVLLTSVVEIIGTMIVTGSRGGATPDTAFHPDYGVHEDNLDAEDLYNGIGNLFSGDDGFTEYTDEEVIAAGEECTGYWHMDITFEEFLEAMESQMEELGIDMSDPGDYSYNRSYSYGTNDVDTYFENERMYDVKEERGYYYVVEWDTFSRRLHEVSYDVYDADTAEEYFVATMNALGENGEKLRNEFYEQMKIAEAREYVFYSVGSYEVYINYYDGDENSYYVSIDKEM